jgi:hypothetical protein
MRTIGDSRSPSPPASRGTDEGCPSGWAVLPAERRRELVFDERLDVLAAMEGTSVGIPRSEERELVERVEIAALLEVLRLAARRWRR